MAARGARAAVVNARHRSYRSDFPRAPYLATFLGGLETAGFVEGRNVAIEYRWAEDRYDQLPALAQDLVRRNVRLIVATGITAATAVKRASNTMPLVFHTGGDPIRFGLVASLNRPGGNATGVVSLGKQVVAKQFELLHELVPEARCSASTAGRR